MAERPPPVTDQTASYREVLGVHEFRSLLSAHVVSLLGDEALRVALALFTYQRTDSALLTAVAYATTFLPWVVAGPVFARYADRVSRRSLLVIGNLCRALIVALMTMHQLALPALLVLVCLAECLAPPVEGASFAILPELLRGDRYVVGASINQAAAQATQVIGFGLGGAIVAVVGARAAFGFDALTFLFAAGLFAFTLTDPYLPEPAAQPPSFWSDTKEGLQVSLGRAGPRKLLLIAWWASAVLLVPEALAAPFVVHVAHGGDTATGWLLAAQPIGMILGVLVIGRLVRPSRRLRLIHPLALFAIVPLIAFGLQPPYFVALGLLLASGAAWSFQVPLQGSFIGLIPAAVRGRAFGVAAAGLQVAQGLGVIVGGVLAELIGITPAIAAVGIVGLALMFGLISLRVPSPAPVEAAAPAPVAT